MPTIAVANQKGGVGKTATVANLGAALAEAGRKVLLVDLDPQTNLSLSLGVDPSQDSSHRPTAYQVLMDGGTSAQEVLLDTPWPGLSLLPGDENLSAAQVQLATATHKNVRLRNKLQRLEGFDYVLVDTPPSLGFLTLNALTAADWVLIPVQTSFLALHGLRQLVQTLQAVREHSNPDLRVGGVLLTMYDTRTLHAHQVQERVVEYFGDAVFSSVVHRSVVFDYATVAAEPMVYYRPNHPCAQTYRDLAQEVIRRA